MKILITEEEKEQIISQHSEPNKDVLNYLRRHYYPHKMYNEFDFRIGEIFIMVDDKRYFIDGNKKLLTNKIFLEIEDLFKHLDVSVIRRTIKKYLDTIKNT